MGSFFGDMLAGMAGGLGQGMVAQNQMDEQARLRKEAEDARMEQARQIQQMRSDDLRYRTDETSALKRDLAELKAGGGVGGGKMPGINLMQMAMQASTPDEQDKVVRLAETMAGPDAAAQLAEKFFKRPLTEDAQVQAKEPDPEDGEGALRTVNKTVTRNRSYDAQKGQQALERVYALLGDPAKLDNVTKAQRDVKLGANADAAVKGLPADDAAVRYQSLTNPTKSQAEIDAKENIADTNAEARVEAAGKRAAGGGAGKPTVERLTPQLNSVRAAMKAMEASMSKTALAANPRYQQYLKDEADISAALRGIRAGGSPAPAPAPAPATTVKKPSVSNW